MSRSILAHTATAASGSDACSSSARSDPGVEAPIAEEAEIGWAAPEDVEEGAGRPGDAVPAGHPGLHPQRSPIGIFRDVRFEVLGSPDVRSVAELLERLNRFLCAGLPEARVRPHRHAHAPRPRSGDEALRTPEIRRLPLARLARGGGVGTVAPEAHGAWRAQLTGRLGKRRAVRPRDGGTVDGVVEGAPHPDVVEWRMSRIEEDEDRRLHRVHVDLRGVARHEVFERPFVLGLLEVDTGDVGSPLLDGLDTAALTVQPELDLVGEPVRAGGPRPHMEVGIADERERSSGHVALDHVRAGRWDRPRSHVPVPCATRDGWHVDQHPQEVASRRSPEVEDDRSSRVVRPDAPAEVATPRPSPAGVGTHERYQPLLPRQPRTKRPFECAPEVARLDELPIRVANAAAELKGIPGSAVRVDRQRAREIRHDPAALAPTAPCGADETVVSRAERRLCPGPTREGRIDRALDQAMGCDDQAPAPMAGSGGLDGKPDLVLVEGEPLRPVRDRDPLHDTVLHGVDARDRLRELTAHPDGT